MTHYTDDRYLYCASEMFSVGCLKIVQSHPEATAKMLASLAEEMRTKARGHIGLHIETPSQGWDVGAAVYAAIAEALEKHVAAKAMAKEFDATEEVR